MTDTCDKNFLDFGIVALSFELCSRREDQERRHSVIPILLAFGEITHFEGGGGATP